MRKTVLVIGLIIGSLAVSLDCVAQAYIKTEYVTSSAYRDKDNQKTGCSGDLLKYSGGVNVPLYMKQYEDKRIKMWSVAVNASYARLNNHQLTREQCPDNMLNTQLGLIYLIPIKKRWSMLAMAGVGIYSEKDKIGWKSVLGTGGIVAIYHIKPNMSVGLGVAVTNQFGIPMIMPAGYFDWKLNGKYQLSISCVQNCEIKGAVQLTDRFKLGLLLGQMDGMSAVMDVDGKSMIFGQMMVSSGIQPEYRLGKSCSIQLTAGGTWCRLSTITRRSLKGFTQSFRDDDNDPNFGVAGYVSIAFKYGF